MNHFQTSVTFTKKLYRKKHVHNVLVGLAVRFAYISSINITSHWFEKGVLIMIIKGEKQVPS